MGNENSHSDYETSAQVLYEVALQHPCLLPDISIDESLVKYSGTDSNYLLQVYSNELVSSVPGFIDRLGSSFGPMTSIPNAVGLGALLISMVMEIVLKSPTYTDFNSYDMLRRVFGEEKASSVRDTMSEYLMRHHIFRNDNQQLKEELRRLEQQLNSNLIVLRNSLLHDGQMCTRGFKIWVNGAAFHLQMLIHQARLNVQTGQPASDYVNKITAAVGMYMQDMNYLLEKFKDDRSAIKLDTHVSCGRECYTYCEIGNSRCKKTFFKKHPWDYCSGDGVTDALMRRLVSFHEPALRRYFSNIRNNLHVLINQHSSFSLS